MPIAPLQLPTYATPQSLDFSSLANLGQVYKKAQNEQKLSDLGKGLADGSIDYRTAAGQAAEMGNIDSVYKFLTLDEARKKQGLEVAAGKDFADKLAPYFGGNASASAPAATAPQPLQANPIGAPPPGAPGAVPPVDQPLPLNSRAPVMSSSKVWGDKEAEDAGLYDRPGTTAQPLTLASLGNPPQPAPSQPTPQPTPSPPQASSPQGQAPRSGGMQLPPASVLIQGLANPHTPTAQKEIAGKLLTRVLDESKPNEKIQYLQQLKDQSGYGGTILQLEMEMRRASKTDVTTNIDQKGETEEAKAAGKAAGERRSTMFASAGAASKTLQQLARMEGLLNQVSQGKLEPGRMSVSAWAKAFGMNDDVATSLGLDPKGVGSAQALQSLVNESVIGKIGAGGFPANNFSDADREFITDIYPKLKNDPRGNKIMVEGARRMAQLDMQRARAYQHFKANPANKGKGFEDFELDFSEKIAKQDMFGDLRKQAEAITGPDRTDIGGTLDYPGAAPRQQPVQGGWQDLGGGVRIREGR